MTLLVPCPVAVAAPSAYVANYDSNTVSQYTVAANGSLSAKSPASVATGSNPRGLVVSPDGKSVYVPNQSDATVSQYTVAANGTLLPKSPATVAAGNGAFAVAVTPDGKHAYVINNGAGTLSQYTVGADGSLTAKSPATIATGSAPFALAVSPDGTSVYTANQANNNVSQFTVTTDGTLAAKSPATVAAGGGPSAVALSTDGRSAYVANSTSATVSQYTVAANGTLSLKSPASVATGSIPTAIAMRPDGQSAYVTNLGASTVSQYTVAADGTLSPKSPASVPTGGPWAIALNADGNSAYIAGSPGASQFTISATGTLTPKNPATIPAGAGPLGIAVVRTTVTSSLVASTMEMLCYTASVRAGQETNCTVTVTGASHPSGTVAFSTNALGGSWNPGSKICTLFLLGGTQGRCSIKYVPYSVGSGSHQITGVYSGDATSAPTQTTSSVTVLPATSNTAVSCSPTSLKTRQTTTCLVTVTGPATSPVPTGQVQFDRNQSGSFSSPACTLVTGTGGSSCSVTYTPAVAAQHKIYVGYSGDTDHTSSQTTTTITATL